MKQPLKVLREKLSTRTIDHCGLIGGPGYSMPDVDQMDHFTFGEVADGALANISVEGAASRDDNIVVVSRNSLPERPVRIIANAKTVGAVIVLGPDFTLRPTIRLFGAAPIVILTGGRSEVGHAGEILVDLWEGSGLFFFGKGSTSNSSRFSIAGADQSVVIGDDCMLADNISVSTHDMHAVIDMDTNRMLNTPGDVIIEPHVWLGRSVSVNKRVCLGLGSVVGAHSLVTKDVERFTVVGGVPARAVRKNATWDRMGYVRTDTVARLRILAQEVLPPVR